MKTSHGQTIIPSRQLTTPHSFSRPRNHQFASFTLSLGDYFKVNLRLGMEPSRRMLNLACPRLLCLIPRITNHENNKEWNEIFVYYKQESMQYSLALIWLTIKIFLYHLPISQWHKCLLSLWYVIPLSGTLNVVQSWQLVYSLPGDFQYSSGLRHVHPDGQTA